MDKYSKAKRSEIMSKISGKDTKPEIVIRKLIFKEGYRYRLHRTDLPGKPDIVFPSRKKVIFINGCFWHGHKCKKAVLPETNKEFWENKINGNKKRDRENKKKLTKLGWDCLVIWQCEIKKNKFDRLIVKISKFLEK